MSDNIPKRKILIFSTAYYPFVAGVEVAIKEITDRLSGDFEFDLITAKLQKGLPYKEKVGNVMVYRVGFGKPLLDKLIIPFYGAVVVWKLNSKRQYSCLWSVMATFSSGAGYIFNIMRFLSGRKKIPMLLTLQEGDSENYLQFKWAGLVALSWKLSLWQADYLTALSNFLIDRAKRNGYKGEYTLVPNGVDVSVFSKTIDEDVREKLKEKLGKNDGDIFLVTSSRLSHKNATDDVITALQYLDKNIYFIVIGKGEKGMALQKQAQELGVADRVKFVGFLPYLDLPKYLSICDIFVRPSRSEGFGNSFIEAMAAKLPVIATPVGGIPDFIDDKETGVFCSTDNPQSIARAVNLILGDPALKQKIVINAYNRVVDRYSWGHVSNEIKNVFDSVIKTQK